MGNHEVDQACHCCTMLIVRNLSSFDFGNVDNAFKNQLFHEKCSECFEAASPSSMTLCSQCSHLRLRHLAKCFDKTTLCTNDDIAISIDPYADIGNNCSFCSYARTCLENHCEFTKADKDVLVRGGHFFLGLPLLRRTKKYLSLGPYGLQLRPQSRGENRTLETSTGHKQDLVVQEYVNWSNLKQYLSPDRQREKPQVEILPYLDIKLQDVRVIDVERSCIMSLPPQSAYVALSYVWGKEPSGQFQTLRENIRDLEQAGSLENVSLPRTITDSIAVCRKLGHKFLWVDRLCIIQDEPLQTKSIQLNQMGAIYRQAILTIVGLAGDGATYGLPGVSQPRTGVQKKLGLCDIELVENTPSLNACIGQSAWQTRGWTFQENATSMALLYFTDFGVYLRTRDSNMPEILAEGPAKPDLQFMDGSDGFDYFRLVDFYSRRTLTFPSDILRAFSGVLFGIYGPHTVYGMPWKAFDRAIMWEASDFASKRRHTVGETFPSWSWTSATGKIQFREQTSRGCSVAIWAMVSREEGSSFSVDIAEPHADEEARFNDDRLGFGSHVAAALAWLNGCISTPVPTYLRTAQLKRAPRELFKLWPDHVTYWKDAIRPLMNVFSIFDLERACQPGRIMVHTQIARFSLNWMGMYDLFPGCHHFLLRTKQGGIAGNIYLGEEVALKFKEENKSKVDLIALSTCRFPEMRLSTALLAKNLEIIPTGELYGCPCSNSNDPQSSSMEHINACPQHPEFLTPVFFQSWPIPIGRKDRNPSERIRAYAKFVAENSYLDSKGALLHPWEELPGLSVLLIRPRNDGSGNVYERIGIGRVSLKAWVEEQPVFKTTILE